MRTVQAVLAASIVGLATAAADLPPAPQTPKKPVVDAYQGVKVADDYQWLEDSSSPAVKQWSDSQNARARRYLDTLPHRAEVGARVDRLTRSSSISYWVAARRGGRLFAYKNDPRLQQRMIVTLASADDPGSERVIVDPNALDQKGGTEIDWFVVSLDGSKVAVSLSKGGSEAGDLHIYDAGTARETGEVIPGVQKGTAGGSAAFSPDGRGFWYTRYPRGSERAPEDAGFYQQVWYHRFGTGTEADTCELGRDLPKIAEIALETKEDGGWVVAEVKNGDGGEVAYYLRPTAPGSAWTRVSSFSDRIVRFEFGRDEAIYLMSRAGSPRGRILRVPLDASPSLAAAVEIVKESDGSIQDFLPTASRLYVNDLLGGPSRVRVFDTAGKRLADVPMPPISSVEGMVALDGDDILLLNGSYLELPAWLQFSAAAGACRRTALVRTSLADYSDCEVIREFAKSKDGTMVPLDIIRKKGAKLDGKNPTVLYGYGGYGYSITPGKLTSSQTWPSRRVWLEQGGVWVFAILRGGGEYGDQWHVAGNLTRKQNVFDDFHACARWLIDHGYTTPARLAIFGESNGGLLMGAALTQHPELYRAVVSRVGIYDMLRVERTTNGEFNTTEFGTVKDPEQFKALLAYSPYHHVVDGVKYPSILLTTGENDPRVDPWHSRKFCARLQAANASSNPVLLRTSHSAGHGMGDSLDEIIAERTDIYAFLFNELGVEFKPLP
ncbi:MAG: prolyl oligopeptidase family serine peptidase [Opitutaceae bacterium]|jgi:prolyl oligopeptidase